MTLLDPAVADADRTAASRTIPVTVARGDGIGPEIMSATLRVLEAVGAPLQIEEIEIGEKVYARGNSAGIEPAAWDSLRRTRVFLKAPITTPQGGGVKSLNVTTRKTLGLFANVRPCVAYHPFVRTRHPSMDVVIIRENEEDTYAGIEHQQTDEVVQCLKLITRPGCERIVRYAFEFAVRHGRRKVTCFTKDNIMKLTDGLFHRVFDEVAREYPSIETEHMIVDIGAARLADTPEQFDVVVMPNLYGDILSDVAAQISGSVGLGGSANIGRSCAMFEAIHGSAPTLAGKDVANPSGLLLSAVMMLVHVGQPALAATIHNAWLRTIEDGIHTADIFHEGASRAKVGTQGFADAVIERLGQQPQRLPAVHYGAVDAPLPAEPPQKPKASKQLLGVDVFLHWDEADRDPRVLGQRLEQALQSVPGAYLKMISNRGVKVYPDGFPETFCTDHWRCRVLGTDNQFTHERILNVLAALRARGFDFIKTENLVSFDGQRAYSLGQGE
jgi:isocitrate dehydrogenase